MGMIREKMKTVMTVYFFSCQSCAHHINDVPECGT